MNKEIPAYHPPIRSTTRGFAAPWNYVQGPGEFDNLAAYSKKYSDSAYVLIDGFLFDNLGARLKQQFEGSGVSLTLDKFGGECSQKEIDRVVGAIHQSGAKLVIGVGGGKTLDTAKTAAIGEDLHLIIVPTSASNDAPVSSLAVIYTEEGVHERSITFSRGSDLVLIDSQIILKAPRRLLVAGMGDALSTYFEAQACLRRQVKNAVVPGLLPCKTAMAIARLSYEILLQDSEKALLAQECGVVNEAFENIIEVNALMSGLGFENTGCSMAHAINAGLSELPQAAGALHGERVGFGVLVQLAFENAAMDTFKEVMDYMASVGLPMTLKQMGVEATDENIRIMADKMVYRSGLAHANNKVVNMDTVSAAIRMADAMGRAYQVGRLFKG